MCIEYGLIGHPLGHSQSASMFNAKFEREGIEARYLNFDLEDISELPALIDAHPALLGLNVTIPYKQRVLPYLHSLSEEAQSAGAVNTIVIERAEAAVRLHGHNTDIAGFRESLRPFLPSEEIRALVLGSGGASRAVKVALQELGVSYTSVSRRAAEGAISYADIDQNCMAAHRLVINATPLGTFPNTDTAPLLPYRYFSAGHIAYDLVYNPPLTRFMREAGLRGAIVVNGAEMLRLQAQAAYSLWTG